MNIRKEGITIGRHWFDEEKTVDVWLSMAEKLCHEKVWFCRSLLEDEGLVEYANTDARFRELLNRASECIYSH